jgi:hypothetical protein
METVISNCVEITQSTKFGSAARNGKYHCNEWHQILYPKLVWNTEIVHEEAVEEATGPSASCLRNGKKYQNLGKKKKKSKFFSNLTIFLFYNTSRSERHSYSRLEAVPL